MLVMEDGHTVNLALWLDPSVHYWAPIERMESIEVIRGTVITHGPNNNFGVINSRNLSPFGPERDGDQLGHRLHAQPRRARSHRSTRSRSILAWRIRRSCDDDAVHGKSDTDISARWHVHTRQSVDNVGLVASYTGADVQGNWDTERLRVQRLLRRVGLEGLNLRPRGLGDPCPPAGQLRRAELPRQLSRDRFDEPAMATRARRAERDRRAGLAEQQFFMLKHCKTCFAPAAGLNTYTGEVWRGQIVHNAYLDEDTTITSRFYAGYHRRDRYQLVSTNAFDPSRHARPAGETAGRRRRRRGDLSSARTRMFGRLRTFRHLGGEVRGEWANQNLLGFKQDFQAGIRYEYQDMTNKNVLGLDGEILENGDKGAATFFDRSLEANTVSAFLQTNIYVASDFNVLPGVRFEWFDVNRRNRVVAD